MSATSTSTRIETQSSPLGAVAGLRVPAALLCLAIAAIHVIDQGGFPGDKDPAYLKYLYYALEAGAVVAAVLLLVKAVRPGWLLALGVAAGPLIAYCLSRGPGLPDATDDKGNWTEPIGVAAIACELVLLVLVLIATKRRTVSA